MAGAPLLASAQPSRNPRSARDTARATRQPPRDSISADERRQIREVTRDARSMNRRRLGGDSASRAALTEAAATTAFDTPEARAILARAREAREQQDSALRAYRATSTQRMSLGMGARRLGLEKLLFQGDNVAEIAWRRDIGVRVRPVGSRMTVPMAKEVRGDMVSAVSIPYFPGREQLWFPSSDMGMVKTEVDEREVIHPLARGAERFYRYELGDSADITLPDARVIRLRELRITARTPSWRTFVGSFWFDRDGGQLVRAAYRLSAEIDIWTTAVEETDRENAENAQMRPLRDSLMRARLPRDLYVKDSIERARVARQQDGHPEDDDKPPAWITATMRPMRAKLDGITVEYALYKGKFWLPRAHSATASADIMFMRIPFRIDEKFTYEDVDGDFTLAPLPPTRSRFAAGDSARADSLAVDRGGSNMTVSMGVGGGKTDSTRQARRDSVQAAIYGRAKVRQCATDSVWTRVEERYEGAVKIAYDLPCDMTKLQSAPELPPVEASEKDIFDLATQQELLDALSMSLQPPWSPKLPTLRTGTDLMRYNRVEGLSVGLSATSELGAGYTLRGIGRIGHADLHANGELTLSRSAGPRTVRLGAYHRLAATNPEWAGALTFGASLPAILYGRDEGFYYRTMGVELGEVREQRRGALDMRLFLERQWTAGDSDVVNTFSLARAFSDRRFAPNFIAEPSALAGASVSWSRLLVERPRGLRLESITRLEAATGTYEFARGSIESTVSRPIGRVSTALTGAIGSSAGRVPVQRHWYAGGLRTVRGQFPGTQSGDAFWLARGELGTRSGFARTVLFYDIGWAGSRKTFGQVQPQRGAGFGFGLLDGLLRLDFARGLYPSKGWRTDIYLGAPL
ncbi:MAG: hypothetical protein LCH84_00435 [Gemmatimonadetes bacterium]|nr:hypothetical protein [Gemmatimonadota bacterium]